MKNQFFADRRIFFKCDLLLDILEKARFLRQPTFIPLLTPDDNTRGGRLTERNAGGKVYLHCTAGQQRNPTCAMSYLMADGETRQSAERIVKEARLGVWAGAVRIDVWKQALELWGRELAKAKR